MKTLNALLRNYGYAFVALLLVFAATGCDSLNNEEPEVAALSEADLETASEILSESLSDQNEGLMASLNDMTADVGVSSLIYDRRLFWRNPGLRPCRGINREFEKTYDETTGVHSINYSKNHEGDNCSKSVEVNLNYTFTDADGNFIETPRANKELISEIAFTGSRIGSGAFSSERGSKSVTFNHSGEWNLTGLQTDVASLTGSQANNGSYEQSRPDSAGVEQTKSGTYNLEFNAVDVTITKSSSETSDLETEITGTIQYTLSMEKTVNGETEPVEVEGTIDLEGNGRALLRFLGLRKVYRVTLHDGRITDTSGNTDSAG